MILNPTHECFTDTLEHLEHLIKESKQHAFSDKYKVCHGIIAPDGIEFSHAWLEEDSKNVWFSAILEGEKVYASCDLDEYYLESKVKEVTKYTPRQVCQENLKSGHYGPWEKKYWNMCRDVKSGAVPKL